MFPVPKATFPVVLRTKCFEAGRFFSESFGRCGLSLQNYTHTSPSSPAHLSLSHCSLLPLLSSLSLLHIPVFIRTKALILYPVSQCWQTSWSILGDLSPGPQDRPIESQKQSPWPKSFAWDGQENAAIACPGEIHFTCVISVITPLLSPVCWESGVLGAELSTHRVWLPPYPWQQATRRSHDPGTTWACWVPRLRIPRISTLRMLSGQHCNDAKPLCSEVAGSDVPSHRTTAMCLHSCDL